MQTPARLRVQFVHGLEGSPQGVKARFLAEHFETCTPHMDTGDFGRCVAEQHAALERFRPDVLVGSSFGGGVVLQLLQEGVWTGPTLLLAQAGVKMRLRPELPEGIPVWLVHGLRDEVVPIEHSRQLAGTGSPQLVELIEVDDTHGLGRLVREGELERLVRRVHRARLEVGALA